MDLICLTCGRVIGHLEDSAAKVRAVCSACQPNPADVLRFSFAIRSSRRLAEFKAEYCAARVNVTRQMWHLWESARTLAPPYDRRGDFLALFDGTPAAPIIQEEVRTWPD